MSSIEFNGLENLIDKLDNIASAEKVEQGLKKACMLVERSAKQNAPKGRTGELARYISSKVENMQGIVFNPLEYAPYVEYGTGAFREENPTTGYWVYVLESEGSTPHAQSSKRYTLEEAKKIVAMMREDGIEAVYTQGRQPRPFMRPALDDNREEIKRILREAIT